jgi:5'-nucleotidase
MKKIIYVDMDGVIANFAKAAEEGGWKHRPDKYVDYRELEVMPGAKEALEKLNQDFDVFIASTPPWDRPDMWAAKRKWIEEHFPTLRRKLILTHRKDLLIGDILIDDSRWRGQPDFKGTWLWFGSNQRCLDWPSTLEFIYKKHS